MRYTPANDVTKVRIQKAVELLVRTEESIERIAETVGYGTGFALSKAFKGLGRRAGQTCQVRRGSSLEISENFICAPDRSGQCKCIAGVSPQHYRLQATG